MKQLLLVRGLPGSGKSTYVKQLPDFKEYLHVETDQFFMSDDGVYKFNPAKLGEAHTWALTIAATGMDGLTGSHFKKIVVSNTFSQIWEMMPYIIIAKAYKYQLEVKDLYDAGLSDEELTARNVHGVPLQVIENMRARWEFYED